VHDVDVVVQVSPPGAAVTLYPVIGDPLLFDALHVMVADVADATDAPVMTGVVGTPGITTALDGADGAEVPMAFNAVTVKVYDVPAVSPVTTQDVAPVVVQVSMFGEDVTV
jgi:hypothetical protein